MHNNIKNAKLLHAVVLGAGKRRAASGKALQAESAASEIQCVKNVFAENFAISNKCMHKRQFAAMSSLHHQYSALSTPVFNIILEIFTYWRFKFCHNSFCLKIKFLYLNGDLMFSNKFVLAFCSL